MVTTAAVRPQSAGVTKGEEEDEKTDELGEEGAEELDEHACTDSRNVANAVKTSEAVARAAFTGGRAPEAPRHPLNPASPDPRPPSKLRKTSRPLPGGCGRAFV